ncbi:heterokaryon incompatibility protein-domain-containing protein [Nemania abortiva]|nr:heterokaryon incompatibility protein-domain-containing protein [Nemania abortiva]
MVWSPFCWTYRDFEYPSLCSKPRAFRLIKLLPPTRAVFPPFRETLNIEIIETNADEAAGEYDTLSYCWGGGVADRTVVVSVPNGHGNSIEYRRIYISASLESALLGLARGNNIRNGRPIFADQICINQADSAEKVQQVRLMGEVYARGARTVVWLGEGTTETSRYLDFLSELSSEGVLSRVMGPNVSHYMKVFDAVMDSSIGLETEAEREDRDDILDLVARYGPRFPLRGLSEILRCAWLNRLWTVQEGCLPVNLTFKCGERSLCYDCVCGGLLFHSIWTTYCVDMPQGPVSKEEIQARHEIYGLSQPFIRIIAGRRAIHGAQAQRRSLYDIVVQYNVNDDKPKTGATKAEDRIYALLGLVGKDDVARETIEEMEVDNVAGTFTKFAASVVKRHADVLLFSQMPKSPAHGHQLPSWVPDWSADPLRIPYGYSDLTTPVFSAGGCREENDIVADASTGVLRVGATLAGRVIRVGAHGIRPDESATIQNVEFVSVRRFFEEIHDFMEEAAKANASHAPDISNEQRRLDSAIRLSDGGLSVRQFPTRFDSNTAVTLLRDIHTSVSHWGNKLRDVETQTRSLSSFTGMIRTAGVMPWYWTPASEIDVIRLCAIDPIAATGAWLRGLFLTMSDVCWVMWYIAKLRLLTAMTRLRQKRAKVDFQRSDRDKVLSNVGLKSDLLLSQEWELYTSNLFKNIGRKLFLTDTGYVGLGPLHNTEVGDAIVVIPGSSVPHILRPLDLCSWSYVGEAYCDGIMDGELIAEDSKTVRMFEIV